MQPNGEQGHLIDWENVECCPVAKRRQLCAVVGIFTVSNAEEGDPAKMVKVKTEV